MSVTRLPPQPRKNVTFFTSALKGQITWQNSEEKQISKGKVVLLWTLTYQTLLTSNSKPLPKFHDHTWGHWQVYLTRWEMCHICISWFFWCIFLLECCFHRDRGTFLPILRYWCVKTRYLVPPACGVSPSSGTLTASHGILCTDHCQQLRVSPSMWSGASQHPQYLCTSARLVWRQLLIQIHHFMYMPRCARIYKNETYIFIKVIYIYIYMSATF